MMPIVWRGACIVPQYKVKKYKNLKQQVVRECSNQEDQ